MKRKLFAGAAVRGLREAANWSQARLAQKLAISASYLNQIEHGHRPLTAPILVELSRIFRVDIAAFSGDGADRLLFDLRDALAEPALAGIEANASELKAAIEQAPGVARAVVQLHGAYRALDDRYQSLANSHFGSEDPENPRRTAFPYDEVRDFFHRIGNYVDELDRSAERLHDEIQTQSNDLESNLKRRLEVVHGVTVLFDGTIATERPIRSFLPELKRLTIDGLAEQPSRQFALAHQLALLEMDQPIREIVRQANFHSPDADAVCTVALANYFAGALVLPYARFLDAARRYRHDLGILTRIFGASIEQVGHRLSTMQRPGALGIPFYFLRVDRAGNITKRHSATRLRFARYGGACPLWNVHQAFEAPDRIHIQIAEMPDGVRYLSLALAITKPGIGHLAPVRRYAIGLGCEIDDADLVVYADDVELGRGRGATRIGTSCRLCERDDCSQRAFPPAGRMITVDPHVRRAVPYDIAKSLPVD